MIRFVRKFIIAFLIIGLILPFYWESVVFAGKNTVYDLYTNNHEEKKSEQPKENKQQEGSLAADFFKFILSFGSIIILLFLVLKYLKAKSSSIQSRGPFHSIGGYPLGSNRSLQMVMVGKTLYILGIGNEVRLIRTIDPGEEQDLILQSFIDDTERKTSLNLPSLLKKHNPWKSNQNWEQTFFTELNKVKHTSFPLKKITKDNGGDSVG